MDESVLRDAARRAYERGRLRLGLRSALLPAAATAVALVGCLDGPRRQATIGLVLLTAALVTLFTWRGRGLQRGAAIGVLAGLPPLLLPLLLSRSPLLCELTVWGILPAAAVLGGALAGSALGARSEPCLDRKGFWLAALTMTAVVGSAGCLQVGVVGLLGFAAGFALGALPLIAWRTAGSN